jgi:hypothetical protein
MRTLLIEAQFVKFGRRKDGSVGFSFNTTREVTNDEFSLIDKYYQQQGWLAFKINEIEESEIPVEQTSIKGQLSPSQILRRKIFALHMKKGGSKDDFTPYYNKVMSGFEQAVQEQIDELED